MHSRARRIIDRSIIRRCFGICRNALAGLALAATGAAAVAAAEWPTRTVTVVVPYAAGGNTDIMARMASQKLSGGLRPELHRRQSRRCRRCARGRLCRPGCARRLHAVLRSSAGDRGAAEDPEGQLRPAQGFHPRERVRHGAVRARDREQDPGAAPFPNSSPMGKRTRSPTARAERARSAISPAPCSWHAPGSTPCTSPFAAAGRR